MGFGAFFGAFFYFVMPYMEALSFQQAIIRQNPLRNEVRRAF
jgi:hypothetical protein